MKIGIDGSRAFLKQKTGIEQYSFEVIKHLKDKLDGHQVILYVKSDASLEGFVAPENWRIKAIKWKYFWTQAGLSLEMLLCPVDVLFVPSHTVPLISPKNTVVTIHGLEYEILPSAYYFWERLYMRLSIKNSCRWANKIIAVSENTKKDLAALYRVPEDKIKVVYEGVSERSQISNPNFQIDEKILLFVGRLEERKNVAGIIRAFGILKEKYKIPHKLILAGKFGYEKERIRKEIDNSDFRSDIILAGFVSEKEKWALLGKADIFLFPTFYEGFGLPILEAQSVGTPVVASNNSSVPEVAGDAAILADPQNAEQIAEAAYSIISDEKLRKELVEKGYVNVKRFSWDKCASEIAETFMKD